MKDLYNKLYDKLQENVAQPIPVANPIPLYNKTTIKDEGKYNVRSFAEVNSVMSESGGNLEYVVPEQTVAVNTDPVELSDTHMDLLETYDEVLFKYTLPDALGDTVEYMLGVWELNTLSTVEFINQDNKTFSIYVQNGKTYLSIEDAVPGNYTVVAIKAPF